MKTEAKAAYPFPLAQQERSGTTGVPRTLTSSSSSSSSLSSAFPGATGFARAALALVDDLTTLFDPLGLLLDAPRSLTQRPVRSLPQPAAQPPGQRARADSDIRAEHFISISQASTAAPSLSVLTREPDLQAPRRASLATIEASSADAITDTLMPVRGGNALLATAMMPPTRSCGFQRTPAAWRVSQLRELMDDGNWRAVAGRLPHHSAQRAVALALASCPPRESKGSVARQATVDAGWRMESLIVPPGTTVPDGRTPLALQTFGSLRAAAVIGSTYPAAASGAAMDCQDGVYLSPHATVVTDGLGGHESVSAARRVRVAQVATGQLVTHLVETIARTEARPAEFLRLHLHALLRLVDRAVASALVAPYPEKDRADYLGAVQARAAFVAVANLRDGTVAFGVGDCTAHLFARELDGSLRVVTFTPQPGDVADVEVGGLGDGTLGEGQVGMRPFPPGVVERVVAGTDGVFDAHRGHLELVAGRTPSARAGRAQVGQHELAGLPAVQACDEIVTRLTQRTRAYWADQQSLAKPGVAGLDDIALVVRDFKKKG